MTIPLNAAALLLFGLIAVAPLGTAILNPQSRTTAMTIVGAGVLGIGVGWILHTLNWDEHTLMNMSSNAVVPLICGMLADLDPGCGTVPFPVQDHGLENCRVGGGWGWCGVDHASTDLG